MYKRKKRLITLGMVVLLIILFTAPRAYLARVCGAFSELTDEAGQISRLGGDPSAPLAAMLRLYEAEEGKLKLFLEHDGVDELGAAVRECRAWIDPRQLLIHLNAVDAAAEHLLGIETLGTDNLF